MRQQAGASVAMSLTQDLEAIAGQAEIAVLESWWSHELRCESPHTPSRLGSNDSGCTVTATHRVVGCWQGVPICQSRADFMALQIHLGTRCADCLRPASECWQIIAI